MGKKRKNPVFPSERKSRQNGNGSLKTSEKLDKKLRAFKLFELKDCK